MEKRWVVTEHGKAIGWVYMHMGGWVLNPESRYSHEYTPATAAELDAAVKRGEFTVEYGRYVNIGGILHDWVPETELA